jgi:hypothetical protein
MSSIKRGKGKHIGSIRKNDFYKYYQANAKLTKVDRIKYNGFLKELLETFGKLIIEEGLELKLNQIGKIRIRTKTLNLIKPNGDLSRLKVDWKATWDHWFSRYPNLSKEEIVEIKDKKLLYHDNEHSNQEFYVHYWNNFTSNLKYKSFYDFKPSRQYSRLLAKVIKDPNRKIFYYG